MKWENRIISRLNLFIFVPKSFLDLSFFLLFSYGFFFFILFLLSYLVGNISLFFFIFTYLIHSFMNSFIPSFVRSFVRSFIRVVLLRVIHKLISRDRCSIYDSSRKREKIDFFFFSWTDHTFSQFFFLSEPLFGIL